MRTIKREAMSLNKLKKAKLLALVNAYAKEKQHWLQVFSSSSNRVFIKKHRVIRDAYVKDGYVSKNGLQARMWKLALVDAAEMLDKYYKSIFDDIRKQLHSRSLGSVEKHYAMWLLSGYEQFFDCLDENIPLPKFSTEEIKISTIANLIRRLAKQRLKQYPSIKLSRSAVFDGNCYDVFKEGSTQYIKVMSLEKGKRIIIPLLGFTEISGTIRIVFSNNKIEVHCTSSLKAKMPSNELSNIISIDFGYTEAATDNMGNHYGENLGKILTSASNHRHQKGIKRNKLFQIKEKYLNSQNPRLRTKARNIAKFNLGKQKFISNETKTRASITVEINTALNKLNKEQRPTTLVVENLRHLFSFNRPKHINRKMSSWTKGIIQDRAEFKSMAEGFRLKQVNPAYGSQICPKCDYVDAKNRKWDKFKCTHCGYEDHSDKVAAMNYFKRFFDKEVTLFTPYKNVKEIFLKRFHRRLETKEDLLDLGTVHGRTLDTESALPQMLSSLGIDGSNKCVNTVRQVKERKKEKIC